MTVNIALIVLLEKERGGMEGMRRLNAREMGSGSGVKQADID